MQNFLRSRLSTSLTTSEVIRLSNLSKWSESDVIQWYERFTHCYPCGYLTLDEFGAHLQYITIFQNQTVFQLDKYIIKQIFNQFDKDDDKKLNFEEILQCHLFLHGESNRKKLKFILKLYNREKTKHYTRTKVCDILMNLFDLFNVQDDRFEREKKIYTIVYQIEPSYRDSKISWTNICRSINKDVSIFRFLITTDDNAAETSSLTHL